MGAVAGLGLLLLVPSAPAPGGGPPRPPASATYPRADALDFAHAVVTLASQVEENYAQPVDTTALVDGAVSGLYEACGRPVPDDVRQAVGRAGGAAGLGEVLADARTRLGNDPALAGPRALFAAAAGFRHATDPHCGLYARRVTAYASVDMDCGIGMELAGAGGARWLIYQIEAREAAERPAARRAVAPPATLPWTIKRVIPGSPAQRAGFRPGDVVTHYHGTEVLPATAAALFRDLANESLGLPEAAIPGLPPEKKERAFRLRRPGSPDPIEATIRWEPYAPETVFGVYRETGGGWDYMLDKDARIGYVRVGSIEVRADERVAEAIQQLQDRGCRGLILDMRWCPGGYVDPGVRVAGLFLPTNALITKVSYRNPDRVIGAPEQRAPPRPDGVAFLREPLIVLVGPETSGGGEMIAAALQDHKRATVLGQRTLGKGNVQTLFDAGAYGLQFKMTTGYSLRPNGRSRHRLADSKPGDDWGVRPNPGLEVPATADAWAKLREMSERHSLRPGGSREALPFDDPALDPQRLMALRLMSKTH